MEQPKDLIKGKRYKIETAYTEGEGIFTGYHQDGSMYFMSNAVVMMIYPNDWDYVTKISEVS